MFSSSLITVWLFPSFYLQTSWVSSLYCVPNYGLTSTFTTLPRLFMPTQELEETNGHAWWSYCFTVRPLWILETHLSSLSCRCCLFLSLSSMAMFLSWPYKFFLSLCHPDTALFSRASWLRIRHTVLPCFPWLSASFENTIHAASDLHVAITGMASVVFCSPPLCQRCSVARVLEQCLPSLLGPWQLSLFLPQVLQAEMKPLIHIRTCLLSALTTSLKSRTKLII